MSQPTISNLRLVHCGQPSDSMGVVFELEGDRVETVVQYGPTGSRALEQAVPETATHTAMAYRTPPNAQAWTQAAPVLGFVLVLAGLVGGWWVLVRPKRKKFALAFWASLAALGALIQAMDFQRWTAQPTQESFREAHVCLSGLAPDTEYEYRVRAGTIFTPTHRFVTAPAPNEETPFRFVALGDSRGSHPAAVSGVYPALVDLIARRLPDFLLNTGDLVMKGGKNEWDAYFRISQPLLSRRVMHTARGNHDAYERESWERFFQTGPSEATWYSFDYANAHIIILDTEAHNLTNERFPSPQLAWLEEDLAGAGDGWIFVVMHRSLYNSSTRHGSSGWAQSVFVDLFDRYGVDVAFMGHDHIYERTHFLYGREGTAGDRSEPQPPAEICESDCRRGTLYVTTGGAGAPLYGLESPLGPFSATARKTHHYVEVSVDGDRVALEAFDRLGTRIDRFEFRKLPRAGGR